MQSSGWRRSTRCGEFVIRLHPVATTSIDPAGTQPMPTLDLRPCLSTRSIGTMTDPFRFQIETAVRFVGVVCITTSGRIARVSHDRRCHGCDDCTENPRDLSHSIQRCGQLEVSGIFFASPTPCGPVGKICKALGTLFRTREW
jgi:hypothetical protein